MSIVRLCLCCDWCSKTCWTGYYAGIGWYDDSLSFLIKGMVTTQRMDLEVWYLRRGNRREGRQEICADFKSLAHGAACIYGILNTVPPLLYTANNSQPATKQPQPLTML
jgi:hypothetical protein